MTAKILMAGTSSGVGKTTLTMGLIAALRRRGLRVQPFKAGPDYIDPTYHALAAGRPCRNIDTWMVPPDRAVALFERANHEADIAVIEGVMGIFDGFSYEYEEGSSAQIAKLVNAPVLLILDVGKMARSAGATAFGYANFDPGLNLAGFILNRCGSESHYQGVKLAVESATALPVVGWLPKDAELHIPERHLGLVPTDERGELTAFIDYAAEVVEQYLDLERILRIGRAESGERRAESGERRAESGERRAESGERRAGGGERGARNEERRSGGAGEQGAGEQEVVMDMITPTPCGPRAGGHPYSLRSQGRRSPLLSAVPGQAVTGQSAVRIAVARDEAFSFYYEDNLDLLREYGAEILFFSPQTDEALPPGAQGIYLGGGFPEIYAAQLSANQKMHGALRRAYDSGIPIYAECGGFMYLTEAIIDLEGRRHPMAGLVPGLTHMQPHLISLGYRIVESPTGNFLLPQGSSTRGHEFHWSTWTPSQPATPTGPSLPVEPSKGQAASVSNPHSAVPIPQSPFRNPHSPAWHIQPRHGSDVVRPDGYAAGNLIASYIHLHFAHDLQLARNFIRACRAGQNPGEA